MIEAIITGIVAILVCMINNVCQQKAAEKKHADTVNLILYRIEQLEKKQDLHNNAVIRLYEVERKLGIDEERIKATNHRINGLEQFHK